MDITPYVEALRVDLGRAAHAMGPDTEQAAARLGFALDSSFRLALMDALSAAAAEVTNELEGTSVEVRLQGREPVFVVVGGPAVTQPLPMMPARPVMPGAAAVPAEPSEPLDETGAETARVSLRLPEALKVRAEELAASRGQSLNTWIVNAVRAATNPEGTSTAATPMGPGAPGRNRSSSKRIQGWVR